MALLEAVGLRLGSILHADSPLLPKPEVPQIWQRPLPNFRLVPANLSNRAAAETLKSNLIRFYRFYHRFACFLDA